MNELVGCSAWLYARLSGDATLQAQVGLRVYADFAPDKDPATGLLPVYPFVVFNLMAVSDSRGVSAQRILTSALYQVKAIGEGAGYVAIQAAADRVDALLQDATGSVTIGGQSYTIAGVTRERPIQYAEARDGVRYSHLGGLYRLVIHPA